nr:MFS transporter [Pseudochryseolinea flava]
MLFFASFNMIIPKLPAYLSSMGGADYKGLIISAFTLTALLSRPFSGKLADTFGRVPVIIVGSVVCMICSLIYPLLTSVSGFVMLRLLHGFSTGFTPTGQAAYLADIIPAKQRGEAMGLLGTAGAVGMAGGAAVGGFIANEFGYHALFFTSSATALISIVVLMNLKESLLAKSHFHFRRLKTSAKDWLEPLVLIPCIVILLTCYAYGAMFTLLPDVGLALGVRNEGVLFSALILSSLAVRLMGGKASDRWGRIAVLRISTMVIVVSTAIIALASSTLLLFVGIVLYGFGQGATSPTLLAWATDLSDENFKARGIASLYIFMELGIGVGAFASGMLYNNTFDNLFPTFMVCSTLALCAFVVVVTRKPTQKLAT